MGSCPADRCRSTSGAARRAGRPQKHVKARHIVLIVVSAHAFFVMANVRGFWSAERCFLKDTYYKAHGEVVAGTSARGRRERLEFHKS